MTHRPAPDFVDLASLLEVAWIIGALAPTFWKTTTPVRPDWFTDSASGGSFARTISPRREIGSPTLVWSRLAAHASDRSTHEGRSVHRRRAPVVWILMEAGFTNACRAQADAGLAPPGEVLARVIGGVRRLSGYMTYSSGASGSSAA